MSNKQVEEKATLKKHQLASSYKFNFGRYVTMSSTNCLTLEWSRFNGSFYMQIIIEGLKNRTKNARWPTDFRWPPCVTLLFYFGMNEGISISFKTNSLLSDYWGLISNPRTTLLLLVSTVNLRVL